MDSFVSSIQDNYTIGSIINLITNAKGWRSKGFSLINVLLIFIIKHYITHSNQLIEPLKISIGSLFHSLFYGKLLIPIAGNDHPDFYRAAIINRADDDGCYYVNGFPIYVADRTDGLEVSYLRGVHNGYLSAVATTAQKECDTAVAKLKLNESICKKFNNNYTTTIYPPTSLFPSHNYRMLEKSIEKYLQVAKLTKNYNALAIRIDGQPGLGKTKSADYLAHKDYFKEVVKIDMTGFLDKDFDEVLKKTYHDVKITVPTLFVFDEVDKYIDYYIQKSYTKKLESAVPSGEKVDKAKVIVKMPVEPKSDYVTRIKTDFLYELLRIVERDGLREACVILFCTNNFHSMFDGISSIHTESLKSRFLPLEYKACDKADLIRYLSYYNDVFSGSALRIDPVLLDSKCQQIRDNLSISYRDLSHVSFLADYDLLAVIDRCNSWVPEPVPEPEPSPRNTLNMETKLEAAVSLSGSEEANEEDEEEANEKDEEDANEKQEDEDESTEEDESSVNSEDENKVTKDKTTPREPRSEGEARVIKKVRSLLDKCDNARGKNKKMRVVGEMYIFLSQDDSLDFMEKYETFRKTVLDKLIEHTTQYPQIKPLVAPSVELISRRFPDFTL